MSTSNAFHATSGTYGLDTAKVSARVGVLISDGTTGALGTAPFSGASASRTTSPRTPRTRPPLLIPRPQALKPELQPKSMSQDARAT